jgi:predicted metal-dependent peptidase
MSKSKAALRKPKPHEVAGDLLHKHYLLGAVAKQITYFPLSKYVGKEIPIGAYCQLVGERSIWFNDTIKLPAEQWLGVLSLATLVLGLGGPKRLEIPSSVSDLAAQLAALHWWKSIKVGILPEHFELPPELIAWGRLPLEAIAARLRSAPEDKVLDGHWTLTRASSAPLMLPAAVPTRIYATVGQPTPVPLEEVFSQALVDNARRALQVQYETNTPTREGINLNSAANRAKRWLINHYPLLGALVTQFDIVEDIEVCRRLDISIAAIQVRTGEIYVNPARALSFEESKFVVAHEVLHAGLCHSSRRNGRDPYLWNVSCDFVINDWLVSMGVGVPPGDGLLYDEALRGWSADDIYVRIASDLRLHRKLSTLRGNDVDMLDDDAFFTDREAFCKQALLQGLDYHQAAGRGTLPQGLVEAIRTLNQPPIPWQAKLAEWIQERFPLPERKRTYARPSRRQSTTPDIPRPRFIEPHDERTTCTFGVVIDTSGSMGREALGKALGAVVSYSQAQAVKYVRLVYCDATPYDEGYVTIDSLAMRVQVRGRGGTVLQPAIVLLEGQRDFPKTAPILVITDGLCEDDLAITRDHAFLVCPGGRLPFPTRAPVFYMQ